MSQRGFMGLGHPPEALLRLRPPLLRGSMHLCVAADRNLFRPRTGDWRVSLVKRNVPIGPQLTKKAIQAAICSPVSAS